MISPLGFGATYTFDCKSGGLPYCRVSIDRFTDIYQFLTGVCPRHRDL
jgi:hypothetical protein